MGLLSTLLIGIFQMMLFSGLLIFIPNLPPYNLNFTETRVSPPVPFIGPLAINAKLNNAQQLFKDELKGPEALEVYRNELYMSVHGGHIVKMVRGEIVPVKKFGQPCEEMWQERICGRPLGFKFHPSGALYCADAYYGISKTNLSNDETITLVSMQETIKDKKPMLPNSIDVTADGTVYWTDSSTTHHLDDGVFIMLGDGSGRVMKYEPRKGKHEVLIDGLFFPNGLVLAQDESYLVIAETTLSRLLKYHLKGSKAGTYEVFVDGLPGMPDNLRSDGKGGFIASLIVVHNSNDYLSISKLQSFPSLRKLLARLMAIWQFVFEELHSIYPHQFWEKIIHWIGHFESLSFMFNNHVLIVFINSEGQVTDSLHGSDGSLKSISDIIEYKGNYYLGSPYNNYLGMVKIK